MNFTIIIPESTIRNIASCIIEEVSQKLQIIGKFPLSDVYELRNIMFSSVEEIVNNHKTKTVDGFTLTYEIVNLIADYLSNGNFVNAVRTFRTATDSDLRTSKEFLDKFERNSFGAASFRKQFMWED